LIMVAFEAAPESVLAFIEKLRARLSPLGGSVVVLQIPDELRNRMDVWGPTRGSLRLMREIKRRFDPGRVLNPGRFVGDI